MFDDCKRRVKRWWAKQCSPLNEAYDKGYSARENGLHVNPYPPGKRHDEWQKGHEDADTWIRA